MCVYDFILILLIYIYINIDNIYAYLNIYIYMYIYTYEKQNNKERIKYCRIYTHLTPFPTSSSRSHPQLFFVVALLHEQHVGRRRTIGEAAASGERHGAI